MCMHGHIYTHTNQKHFEKGYEEAFLQIFQEQPTDWVVATWPGTQGVSELAE